MPRSMGWVVALAVLAPAAHSSAGETLQATIQRVEGGVAELDVGSRHGIAVGSKFRVFSPGKVVRIPLTGTVTYQEGSPIGVIRAVEVYPSSSRCVVELLEQGKVLAPGLDAVLIGEPSPKPQPQLQPSQPIEASGQTAPAAGAQQTAKAMELPAGPSTLPSPTKFVMLAEPGKPVPGQEVKLSLQEAGSAPKDRFLPGVRVKWFASSGCLMAEETSVSSVAWIAPRNPGRAEIRAELLLPGGAKHSVAGVIEVAGEPSFPDKFEIVSVLGYNAFGGESLRVQDVAFDAAGNLYLLDARLRRIFCLERGSKMSVAVSERSFAASGVKEPLAIAVKDEKIYLLDAAAPCIKIFDIPDRPSGKMGEGVKTSDPVDIAVDSRGMVYVADSGLRCFHVFDSNGVYLNVRGRRGQGIGEFEAPVAMAVAPGDKIFVLDRARRDVQVFDQSHRVISRFSLRVEPRNSPVDIAVSSDGQDVYVLEGERGHVARYSSSGELRFHSTQDELRFPDLPPSPAKLAVDPFGRIHVVPRSRIGLYRYSSDGLPEGRFAADAPGRPMCISCDDQGNFAILDSEAPYVRIYDADGWLAGRFGVPTDLPVAFRMPRRLAMLRRGLGVATLGPTARGAFDEPVEMPVLNIFDWKGIRIRQLGSRGTAPGQFILPVDLDTDREGNVYILDRDILRVSVFSWKGAGNTPERERTFRRGSRLAEEMIAPDRLAVDPDTGDMYVYDAKTRLIKKFTKDAIYTGTSGSDMGFLDVQRMKVDWLGMLWVFDRRLQELRRLDFRGVTASVSASIQLKAFTSEALDFGIDASNKIFVLTGRDLVYVLR